jgi:hypothetical protein
MLFLASPPFYERIGNEDFVVRERRNYYEKRLADCYRQSQLGS